MRCIFCKLLSDSSRSKEHIIPESLENKEHVLPAGWVCDDCNNYFARKVEAPFLESMYGQNSRFEMAVRNKKGQATPAVGFHPASRSIVHIQAGDDGFGIYAAPGEDEARFIKSLQSQKKGRLYVPAPILPPPGYETSRFIAKIGLEVLAHRCLDLPGWNDELVEKVELDEIRNYVRRGRPGFTWPISMRRIYPADFVFTDAVDPQFQVLHEFNILWIESEDSTPTAFRGETFAVIAIFGVEYVINLGGPELDGFERWRKANGEQSYLYLA